MGEVENPPVDLPPSPPTQPSQDFCTNLDYNSEGCVVLLSPHPPSFGPFDPPNFGVLCSYHVSDLTCDVHKNQVLDRVDVD